MRLTNREMSRIVRKELPGYRVVSRGTVSARAADHKVHKSAKADAVTPSLTDLKNKYLTGRSPLVPRAPDQPASNVENLDDDAEEIVVVEREGAIDSVTRAGSQKRLVISNRDGKITGMQG